MSVCVCLVCGDQYVYQICLRLAKDVCTKGSRDEEFWRSEASAHSSFRTSSTSCLKSKK